MRRIRDIFVCAPDCPLAKEKKISTQRLREFPLILLEKNTSTRRYLNTQPGYEDLEAEIELSTSELLIEFALRGVGVASVVEDFALPALFSPLDDTMAIMVGSLILGALQVFTGMTVSVVEKCKKGCFMDALFDEITWWIILAGTGLAVLGIGSVSGVPVVLIAGVLMLVYGAGRGKKGFGKVTGFVAAVYNGVTGFFSDILSYVRLMALMLSGAVLAQVFNMLGATTGNVVTFIIIAFVGNMLNLALNLLGCYVHDMRLQFLEFFGRFYKDGGKAYRPLRVRAKHVEIIKEDTKSC